MRRFAMLGSMLSGIAAMFGMGVRPGLDYRVAPTRQRDPGFKAPFAKSSGRQRRSNSEAKPQRLILDRSSSVKKAQRWLNNGTLEFAGPTEKAAMRHKVRRVERQRAANLQKLASA